MHISLCIWFHKCMHRHKGRKKVRKTMEEEIESKGSRYVTEDRCVPDLQSTAKEMRNESSRMHCERLPALSDLFLCFRTQISHCLNSCFLSEVSQRTKTSASHSLSLFYPLTVWWLLSLLCCHGNLQETVGTHYIYSLSSLFENELSVFPLVWHEKCVLTPKAWNLHIQKT